MGEMQVNEKLFPVEIASKILALGQDLNMTRGVTAFYEAEQTLKTLITVLNTYHDIMWPSTKAHFEDQLKSIERFATVHRYNKDFNPEALLKFMVYFPVAKD